MRHSAVIEQPIAALAQRRAAGLPYGAQLEIGADRRVRHGRSAAAAADLPAVALPAEDPPLVLETAAPQEQQQHRRRRHAGQVEAAAVAAVVGHVAQQRQSHR